MSYQSGLMDARITIARRVDVSGRQFGDGGERYEIVGDRWAWATFNKGMKSLREGAMDALRHGDVPHGLPCRHRPLVFD